ncbi:MAG: Calx-beta domain-containing protein [Actinomycetota bacterium]
MTVEISTSDGSATLADSDYTQVTSQVVTFAAGETTQTVLFDVTGDFNTESNETFLVELANPTTGVLIDDGLGQVTITDEDVLELTVGDATVTEGDSGTTAALVDVSLPFPPTVVVTADLATLDGSATTADNDYTPYSDTLTFGVGEQTKQVSIDVIGDGFIEGDETFTLEVTGTSAGLSIADGSGLITITGDDANSVSIGDTSVTEGNAGSTVTATVDVTLASPASVPFDVTVSSADGTATLADGDYQASTQTVSFAIGEDTKSVSFTVNGDDTPEGDEVFTAELSNPPAGVTINDGSGNITITNDDAPSVSIGDAETLEGALGATTPVSVEVSLSSPAVAPVSVTVDTADGTATTADSDYTAVTAQVVSFAIGEQTKTVTVDVLGDDTAESNEDLTLVASAPTGGLTIADGTGTIDIFDDDSVAIVVGDATVVEGADGTTDTVTVDVTLTQPAVGQIDVTIATADGTATTADSDYVASSQVVTFLDTESAKQVTITVNGDDVAEADEVFLVQASNVVGTATIGDGTGEVTITNDDSVSVSIADGSIVEGDAGTSALLLDVTLSAAAPETVTVEVGTADGTATTADSDYTAVSGQVVTFAPGQTAKQVSIPVIGDEQFEDDEDFTVNLTNPSAGLTIGDGSATATITNDEVITVSVGDATIAEGDSGTAIVSVDVTLSDPADQQMTVLVDTADISATAGTDYVDPGQQTVTFNIGESTQSVDITVNGDTAIEPDESFSVTASSPTGGLVLGDATGVVTITNDDVPSAIDVSISDVTVDPEGTGANGTANVTVSLSAPAQVPVTLDVSTGPATPETATAGADYTAITDQQVAFAVGEQSKVISIDIVADSLAEVDETFELVGTNLLGSNVSFAKNIGVITIVDDDPITVSVSDVTVTETDSGANNLLATFTLNGPSFQTVVIDYATQDGTATVADVDYIAKSGEVRFAPGVTVLTRGIQYIGDTNVEPDEFFEVVLSNPINTLIGQGTATITILDDDTPPPMLTVGDVTVDPEGASATTTTATVDLTLDIPAVDTASFTLATVDGSATELDGDYVALNQTVTFTTGEQAKTIDITINGDDTPEINEQLTVVASNPVGKIGFSDDTGTITVVDDDGAVIASVQDVTIAEGDAAGGNTDVTVTVNLSSPATGPMSVDLTTSDGTAEAGAANPDYVTATQTVSFNLGDTTGTAVFQVVGDDIAEDDENFFVTGSNPTGGLLVDTQPGEVTITDDDNVLVSVSGIAITERDAGTKNAIVTFTLSKPSSVSVSVDYATQDGTATLADNDYLERIGDVRFPPLATTRTRGFTIVGDLNEEENEIFNVLLSNPVNAQIGTGTGVVTILDDDVVGNPLTVGDATVVEGDSGTTTVDVTLSLQDPAADAFTVDVETLNGTAVSGTDYQAINPAQTVSFAQGDQSQTVTLNVNGDTDPEADETFALVASNSSTTAINFADNTGLITVFNDDLIDVSVGDATVAEGAATTTVDATVTVSLSQPAIGTMTVDVASVDGSATVAGSDYVAVPTQTLVFSDGEQTQDVTVTVNGDDDFETDESFSLVVGTVTGDLNVLDGAGEVTITNDDTFIGSLSVVVGGATVVEPDAGSTVNAVVDVTLTEPATSAVSLDIVSSDGTATIADSDYVAVAETVNFAIGEQTKQVTVIVNGDDAAEFDETLTLVASNPSVGLAILDGVGEVVILNNDAAPLVGLTVTDVTVVEGDSGTTTASVNLVLDQPPVFPVSVDVSTGDGTATLADGDYTQITGQTVTFGSGVTSQVVDVDVTGDTNNELDEAFNLIASNPSSGLTITDDTGEITIQTDDAIMISVGDVTLTEIDAGFRWAQVPFTLTAAPATNADTVVVDYTTVDGTATVADGDYEARSQELRFGVGVTSITRGIRIFGDTDAEANEVLTVELSNVVNAQIGDGIGEITILDDDTATIGLTVGDVSIAEGDAGASIVTVTLNLDSPAVNPLTVDVETADGTATAGSDYVALPLQTVTFNPNDQSKTVDITINGDTAVEPDETFDLVASNPSLGLALTDGTGTVTILHDDQPRLTVSDVTVTEGDTGTTTAAVLVDLDRSPTQELTVVVSTVDGSATIADNDYTAVGETLTFAIGEQSKAVNVFINGDTTFETDEELSVVASNPSAGLAIDDDTGVITVTNDDTTGTFGLIVGDASVVEGPDATTTVATVDLSLSFPAPGPVDVTIDTADGTATTADGDYVAISGQTVSFATGEQFKQVQVTVNGDGDEETDETFTVVASNPTGGAVLTDGTGVVNVLNDDVANLQVSVGDAQEVEGESGTVVVSVPVTLNKPSPVPVSVEVSTVDDTATTADNDYVAISSQLVNFPANEVNATVDITINGDTTQELNETFNLVASNPSAELSLGDDTGVITIVTDDGVTISVADVTMTEIDAGFKWAQVSFTLSAAPGSDTFTVDYTTQDGTATAASGDYETRSGDLRFANNTTTLTRGFKVFGDQTPEADEVFSVVLSNPVNGSIADGVVAITILDDDNTGIDLNLGDVTVTEGDAGSTVAAVPLTLDIPALSPLTVSVSTVDGTATTADVDYSSVTLMLTFLVCSPTANATTSVTEL